MRKVRVLIPGLLLALLSNQAIATPSTTAEQQMKLFKIIGGAIAPKSVLASNTGLVSAQNMMYRHTVTLYDATTAKLIATIKDSVRLSDFGFTSYQGIYQGAPVEGAFSPDGKYLYYTNYSMYGAGYNGNEDDKCSPASKYPTSFLSRVNLATKRIDAMYAVGSVPKVVRVTPDNKYLLVANWCSYNVTIISVESGKTVATVKIGPYPRGMAISSDSKYAYVAEMGGLKLHRINLVTLKQSLLTVGLNPRAIVLSPDGKRIYITLSESGTLRSWNIESGKIEKSAKVGDTPRSLDISSDGSALFVVNYVSNTMMKVRSADLKIMETVKVCERPIGVTFDASTQRTWVACYSGVIQVFDNL